MRILFMGTPEFSVPTLISLTESQHEIIGVVTQPDKPKGRGNQMIETPIKQVAIQKGIPVHQPVKVRAASFLDEIRQLAPDVIIVIAYGQILPKALLEIPKYGCINVHASLLPKYRGAGPIQWCIINGEVETGVTIMQMDVGLDTGDMLMTEVIAINEKETGGSLHDKLMVMGGPLVLKVLEKAEEQSLVPVKQDDSQSNYAPMLTKELGNLDFNKSAIELERLIRGLNPWPSAYTTFQGKLLKIWDADVVDYDGPGENGQIVQIDKNNGFTVKTAQGGLLIKECQIQGKNRVKVDAFMRGYTTELYDRLGE